MQTHCATWGECVILSIRDVDRIILLRTIYVSMWGRRGEGGG